MSRRSIESSYSRFWKVGIPEEYKSLRIPASLIAFKKGRVYEEKGVIAVIKKRMPIVDAGCDEGERVGIMVDAFIKGAVFTFTNGDGYARHMKYGSVYVYDGKILAAGYLVFERDENGEYRVNVGAKDFDATMLVIVREGEDGSAWISRGKVYVFNECGMVFYVVFAEKDAELTLRYTVGGKKYIEKLIFGDDGKLVHSKAVVR